jgi:CHC2 zinc finger
MLTPRGVYPGSELSTSGVPPNDGNSYPHDLEGLLRAVERRVPVIDVADLLCGPAGNRSGLRRMDDRWVGRCPLPHCASRLPSFAVWPNTDAWRCFSCMRGGDATELERLVGHALVAKARGGK